MIDLQDLHSQRLARWQETPETKIAGVDEAVTLIERIGVITLYPVSSEVPDLFHAYVGDAGARTDSKWDSPSGEVYGWRWTLGRRQAAFYTAVVRDRPTWVSWSLLPAIIRLRGELRSPEELYDAGELSHSAHRVAQALAAADGVLGTGDLRKEAGFPTGKEHRAAYLKAVEELDTRLLLAKVFSPDDTDMRHALVRRLYGQHVAAAERLSREEALRQFLMTYLPPAVYALPAPLAKHLKLPETELRLGLEQLVMAGHAAGVPFAGHKGSCYVWEGATGTRG